MTTAVVLAPAPWQPLPQTAQASTASPAVTRVIPDAPCDRFITPNATYLDTDNHFRYTTDAEGRPSRAESTPDATFEEVGRTTNCATRVGNFTDNWHGVTLGGRGWDGGHLVADTLGGATRRYNLVPMLATTVNRSGGVFYAFEDVARKCRDVQGVTIDYYQVDVTYLDNGIVFPASFHVQMGLEDVDGTQAYVDETIPWNPTTGQIHDLKAAFSDTRNQLGC
ncbi:DNA/RNA non-specific endonuclease [Streptomyces sp. NPDC092903]|uniref:DNA/RNA non-specific endonuclease n=1 Tax=Streptomyces sp. NPDC092903 TaxID=3366017 RepID=UPI0037F9F086